jgi:hypothetical protein
VSFTKMIVRRCLVVAATTLPIITACFGAGKAHVDIMTNGVYLSEKVTAYAITGARNGATTHAVAVFTMKDGDHIKVEMNISYNPTPELADGHWQRDGKVRGEGPVHDESLKFLGGQGATPSVGGRLRLDEEGGPRMRVTLPVQPLAPATTP